MAKYRFEQIAINCTQKRIPTEDDNAGYIGLEHLDSGSLTVTRWGSQVPLKGEKLVMHKGDVLLGKRNAYLRRAAVCPHDGVFSAHGMVLQPKEEVIDKSFFPLFIASNYFFDEAIRISVGSLSPTVNWKDLKNVVFDLPSIDEQKRLASVLWAINDTIESYKRLISATDDLVKSQFIEMFGMIDATSLCNMAKVSAGQSSPYDEEFSATGTPFIKAGDLESLKKRVISENDCNLVDNETIIRRKLKLHGKGTVLVAKSGMSCLSGHVYALKEPAYIVSHLACIEPIEGKSTTEYLRWLFITCGIKDLIKDPSYPSIQLSQLNELQIPNASYSKQLEFSSFASQSDKSKLLLGKTLDFSS